MMTGRQPREFGVRVNNQTALGTAHPTLASIFKQKGYRTAAFVASFVLDSRFGLDRGFDVYDDEMSNVSIKTEPLHWERPANVITDRAIAWLDSNKKDPFFCWVHFFDPHGPYNPPKQFPPTYDGEIAYMDTQIKRLDDWLTRSGMKDKTLLIIVGDHGESFGEHGEDGHGIFLYQTSLHVPMLVAHPTLITKPTRIAHSVGVIDLFPTILELLDLPKPNGLLSASFASDLQTGQSPLREIYSESEYVWHSYGWAQQRSLTNSDWKFVSTTKPELYDRKTDPDEKNNLFDKRPDIRTELSGKLFQRYAEMVPTLPGKVAPSAAATAALSALGYTGGGSKAVDEFLTAGADDPKEKLGVVRKYKAAREFLEKQKYDEAIELLKACVAEAPQSPALQGALGVALLTTQKYEEAIAVLDEAAKLDPTHQPALFSSGDAYFRLNRFDKALQFFTLAIDNDPNDPTAHFMLGKTLVVFKKPDEARPHFEKAVELLPDFSAAHYDLAVLLADAKEHDRAIPHYQQTIRLEPNNDHAHYQLGLSQLTLKQTDSATKSFYEAARINPQHGPAWINLGLTLLQVGQTKEGKNALQRAAAIPDTAADAYYNLAIAASRENDPVASAQFLQKVIDVAPTHPTAAWDLARDHLKADRMADTLAVLRAAEKANPSNVRVLNLLASILATAGDDALRNGQEALRIAKSAAALTQSRNAAVLKTLAESYAETGDFPNAIATAQQALTLIPAGKHEELRSDLTAALSEYQAGRPLRRTRFQ
jgi:tetratricopeptide (TPR) repeat protein